MTGKIYCMSDIHNDYDSFREMLEKINFSKKDKLYINGDIFDRGYKPVELYFEILKYQFWNNITCIRGNHDQWFADYIRSYYSGKKQSRYFYNTFELMRKRLTDIDMQEVATWIEEMPLYAEIMVRDKRVVIAHAQTAENMSVVTEDFCLMGNVFMCEEKKINACVHNWRLSWGFS